MQLAGNMSQFKSYIIGSEVNDDDIVACEERSHVLVVCLPVGYGVPLLLKESLLALILIQMIVMESSQLTLKDLVPLYLSILQQLFKYLKVVCCGVSVVYVKVLTAPK